MQPFTNLACAYLWGRQARDDLQALKLEEAALQAGSAKPVAGVSQEQQDIFL